MTTSALLAAAVGAASASLLFPRNVSVRVRPSAGRVSSALGIGMPLALIAVTILGLQAFALFVVGGLTAVGVADMIRRDRRRRGAAELRADVVEAGEALAGEIRAGRAPVDALSRLADQHPYLQAPAETARLGGDVPTALRAVACRPGAESLVPIAASWHLSNVAGASLAEALDRATEQARVDLGVSTLVDGELASARATARLLAVLPFLVLALGRGLGFDPWGFLFRSWPGVGCLALGVVLSLSGLRWVDRIGEQGDGR